MTVFAVAGRWYHERVVSGRRVRESFGRGEDAHQRAIDRQRQVDLQRSAPHAVGILFDDLAASYLELHGPDMETSTVDRMVRRLNATILPALGVVPAVAIGQEVIDGYVDLRRQAVGSTTVYDEVSLIKRILRWGVRRRLLPYNPAADIEMPKRKRFVLIPPTQDEAHRIWMSARSHIRRFAALGWFLGARAGKEILSLTWEAVDLQEGVITITSALKRGLPSRRVRLHPVLWQWMREWRQADDHPYIVHWGSRGMVRDISAGWKSALHKAGITRRIRPYDLRHAFATSLINQGAPPSTVQVLMGHRQIQTTLGTYTHASQEVQDRAIGLVPDIGSDPKGESL